MNTSYVKVANGSYRNMPVQGDIFPLVKQFQIGAKGGFITVDGSNKFGIGAEKIRIRVNSPRELEFVGGADYFLQSGAEQNDEQGTVETVTDEVRMKEIAERFNMLDELAIAAINGDIRALIVSGPPGVGKSFGVERELERATLVGHLKGHRVRGEVIKGSITPVMLYCTLYKYSDKNSVIVFDDCDSVLFNSDSLNLLKGVLDSGKKRRINWLKDSNVLVEEGAPNSFDFNGTIIFITNQKFDQMRSSKIKDDVEALQSRCHYLDLTLDTMRDKVLRVRQIAQTGELFSEYDFEQCVQDEIIDFMDTNQNRLREMSLRMAIKIAELRKSFPNRWKELASTTCMRNN